jgi:hypothetical protein
MLALAMWKQGFILRITWTKQIQEVVRKL